VSVTRAQFDEEFDKLLLTTNPRGWSPDRTTAYYNRMKGWDIGDLRRVCAWMATDRVRKQGSTAFPELAEFFQCRKAFDLRDRRRTRERAVIEGTDELTSCAHCIGGRIWFDVKHGRSVRDVRDDRGHRVKGKTEQVANVYERFAACSCDSGTIVAASILAVARRARRPASMESVRYENIFAGVGGLDTAESGEGVRFEKPKPADPAKLRTMVTAARSAPAPSPVAEPDEQADVAPGDGWDSPGDDFDLPF